MQSCVTRYLLLTFSDVGRSCNIGDCAMQISQELREYAREHDVEEQKALDVGMAEMSDVFKQQGAEIYKENFE